MPSERRARFWISPPERWLIARFNPFKRQAGTSSVSRGLVLSERGPLGLVLLIVGELDIATGGILATINIGLLLARRSELAHLVLLLGVLLILLGMFRLWQSSGVDANEPLPRWCPRPPT